MGEGTCSGRIRTSEDNRDRHAAKVRVAQRDRAGQGGLRVECCPSFEEGRYLGFRRTAPRQGLQLLGQLCDLVRCPLGKQGVKFLERDGGDIAEEEAIFFRFR